MPRLRPIAALVVALGLVLTGGATVLAKGGEAIATLDEPLPPGPVAGSTVKVGWSLDLPQGDGTTLPFYAESVFVRFSPATGKPIEVAGRQDRQGHFVATVKVPAGGLGDVAFGLRGEACDADGHCGKTAEFFRINPTSATEQAAAAARAAAAPAPGQRHEAALGPAAAVQPVVAADPVTGPVSATPPIPASRTAPSADIAWLALLAVIGLALAGVAIAARGRSRTSAA